MTSKLLTKSKYMFGLQCPAYLWIAVNKPEMLPEKDEAQQHLFDEGTKVGLLAQSLFPSGMNAQTEDFMGSVRRSKELLKERKPLFEAGFLSGRCYSRADILEPHDDGWDLIEVKMGTRVKSENIDDVAFQKYVYNAAGVRINKCFLMHINNEYVKHGEIDASTLFVKKDITAEVDAIKDVAERVEKMLKVIDLPSCPEHKIGGHCSSPHECPLIEECFKSIPEHSVFDLYRGGIKCFELFDSSVLHMKDIPDDFELTSNQQIQRTCARTGKGHLDKPRLKEFLDKLEYPLYFLDFETYQTAIPLYDGLHPYQQIPFQFSLHIQERPKAKLKHISFLAEGSDDPRRKFIEALADSLGDKGNIIVYNQSFESGRIKELAEMFPEHKAWAGKVIKRMVDLLIPFRNFYYYNPLQKGSASIKKVLPAVTGHSYEGLEIADGGDASLQYLNITHGKASKEEIKRVREGLEKYCGLDTEGEVWIVEELRKMCE